MAAAAAVLFCRSRSRAASFVTVSCSLACRALISWTASQVTPATGLPGERLCQLDLERVHRRDVMHDDADLAPVHGNRGLPLRVCEGAGEAGKIARPLFEANGQGVRTLLR